ncbi:MAG: PhzF family phenazine biosynthesis protein [Planctomycetes bacterium]|nr:PhzF family phenazine biosynthesis protein [Planctomycetota bacterium]
MRTVVFRLVDAFAEKAYMGNPAGVVLDADGLSDAQAVAIAREVNASETAFIFGGNDLHRRPRIRWFTPTSEVGFCGHATLAAAHAWCDAHGTAYFRNLANGELTFDSRAGILALRPEALPARPNTPIWWLSGWLVTTRESLTPSIDATSRFFAPAFGVPEDPVTGSVHGPLATLLVANEFVPMVGRKASLTCVQGQPGGRTGLVRVLVESTSESYSVHIGGVCHVIVRGEMLVPEAAS